MRGARLDHAADDTPAPPQRRRPLPGTVRRCGPAVFSALCTARAWKFNLQHRLCNRHRLRVTVAHYPPATSTWNPIEHRLFCEVTKNWAGHPLDSYETILKYLRTTRTATGLRVRAHLVRKTYKTGVKVTEAQMREHTEQPPSQMELHHRTHVTKNGSYFCAGPKWIPQNRVILPQSCGKFSRRRSDAHGRVRSSS